MFVTNLFMKFLFLIIFLADGFITNAQVQISGKVTDNKKHALAGASISIENSYDGTTADSLGNFKFMTAEKGKQVLIVSMSGYTGYTDTLFINSTAIEKNIVLHSLAKNLDAVVITAGTFAAGDQNKSAELSTLDVVTTASANADITGAIKTLPGSQQVGESEGLFVRGGTGDETKIFIDGTLVNNFFYTSEPGQATRGRFNPFLFKGTVFSSGGYSALYGQAMSSVLLLESIDLPEKTSASLGVSYLSANGGIQKLSKNKKSSWGLSYSYANLGLVYGLVRQKADYFKVPVIHELDGNFRIKTKRGMVKYYGYFSSLKLGYRYFNIDSAGLKNAFSIDNMNYYHNLTWKEKLGQGWKIHLGGSYSNNQDKIKTELNDLQNKKVATTGNPVLDFQNFRLKRTGQFVNLRWTLEKNLGGLSAFRFGNEYNYSNVLTHFYFYNNTSNSYWLKEQLFASYAEADIYLMPKLAARAGARAEHSALLSKWNVAPRGSLAYQFPDRGQVSFAYGIFYQNPDNKYLPSSANLHFENATHYILQYQKIAHQRIFRSEIFYKKYDDLIKASGNYGRLTAVNNEGFGDAKGVEVFLRDKKSFKNIDYWISYSYLDTRRNFLNYPSSIEPPFSSKHTASIVFKTFILPWKLQVNASYTFATGRPYYDFHFDENLGQYTIREQGRTKDYNDLSLSLNYVPAVGKKDAKSFSVLVLSVTNVPGFKNVYSYNFSADGSRKVAVLPAAKRFYYLGYFISFGIDRTEEAINNHL